MTQVSSTNPTKKKRLFSEAAVHNLSFNVKDNFKLMIIIFVLHLAAVPMLLTAVIATILSKGQVTDIEGFAVAAVLSTCIAAASGIICALSVFKYLYSKPAVDMRLSLPMSTGQRFVSDFLSGLIIYIVPYFAAELISWIVMLIGHILCDGKTFTYKQIYSPTDNFEVTWLCEVFEKCTPFLWRGMLGGLLLMIMFYSVTVIAASCCGNIFESVCYGILLNVLVPVSAMAAIDTICNDIEGLEEYFIMSKILPYCGPFGGAYGVILSLESYNNEINHRQFYIYETVTFGKWLAIFTLLTIAVTAVSFLVYRKRKAEDTGKPVVYGALYHIIMTLGIFSLSYLMIMDGTENFIPVIIICAIVYLVMHVVRNRGFGKIIKGVVICAFTILGSIGSFLLIKETEAFGAGSFVPEADSVKKAEINYGGSLTNISNYSSAEITDPASLEILTKAHSEAIEYTNIYNRYGNPDFYDTVFHQGLTVCYTLKSGRTVVRQYYSIGTNAVNTLSQLDMTEEVKATRAENARESLQEDMPFMIEDYLSLYNSMGKRNTLSDLYAELCPQWQYEKSGEMLCEYSRIGYDDLPEDFAAVLGDRLYEDIMAETEEEYHTPSGKTYSLSVFGYYHTFIKDSYKNTMSYLAECGFTFPTVNETLIRQFTENKSIETCFVSLPLAEYISGKNAGSSTMMYFDRSLPYGEGSLNLPYFAVGEEYYDDILTLFENSYKEYKTDESCYTIIVNGNRAVISPEYIDIAERVYIRTVADTALTMYNRGFWDDPQSSYYANSHSGYSAFLVKFLEFYGEEKIISALSGYYDREYAEDMYGKLCEWSKADTDVYDEFDNATFYYRNDGEVIVKEGYYDIVG